MSGPHDPLVEAAMSAFEKFGYRRTTMGDVAAAAGLSRPAMYLRVRNKDELLMLASARLFDAALERATTAARTKAGLGERLYGALAAKLDIALELTVRTPHAEELLAEHARLHPSCASEFFDGMTDIVADVMTEVVPEEKVRESAVVLLRAVGSFEEDKADPDLARARLRLLVDLVVDR